MSSCANDHDPTKSQENKLQLATKLGLISQELKNLLCKKNSESFGGLYLIKPTEFRRDIMKIGCSNDIYSRLLTWNYSFPFGIEIIAVARIRRRSLFWRDWDPVHRAEEILKVNFSNYKARGLWGQKTEWLRGETEERVVETMHKLSQDFGPRMAHLFFVRPRPHLRSAKFRTLSEPECKILLSDACKKRKDCKWLGRHTGCVEQSPFSVADLPYLYEEAIKYLPDTAMSGLYIIEPVFFRERVIKVGCGRDLRHRLKGWQEGNPYEVRVWALLWYDPEPCSRTAKKNITNSMEAYLLTNLSRVCQPLPHRKEWFPISALQTALDTFDDYRERFAREQPLLNGAYLKGNTFSLIERSQEGPVYHTPCKHVNATRAAVKNRQERKGMPTPTHERECRKRKATLQDCMGGNRSGSYDGVCELEYVSPIARNALKCVPMKKHLPCNQRFITRPPYCAADMNNCEAVRLKSRKYSICLSHGYSGSETESMHVSEEEGPHNQRQDPRRVGNTRSNLLALFDSSKDAEPATVRRRRRFKQRE